MNMPKPKYRNRNIGWSSMDGGCVDVWTGADASDFPEILDRVSFIEIARTPWSEGVEIVVERGEDLSYVYIVHRHPTEGGDTGTVFRYYK